MYATRRIINVTKVREEGGAESNTCKIWVHAIKLVLLVAGEAGEIDRDKTIVRANVSQLETLSLVFSAQFQLDLKISISKTV